MFTAASLPGRAILCACRRELTDVWGDSLGREYSLSFTNGNLPPGILVTHQSEALFLTTRDNAIPLQVTNLSALNPSLGAFPLTDFISMLSGENGYELRRSYQPDDQRSWQQPIDVPVNQT